jgi:hypothetical protein
MAYNPNIPQATDVLSQSQGDLLNNFMAINTFVIVDHAGFSDPNEGKHNKVTFPVQNPAPTFLAGEIGLYSFLNPVTSANELYVANSASPSVATPMTASILSTNANPGNNVSGWTYLPSGLLLKWGNVTANGNTAFLFPVAADIPVFTNVMSMQITTYANSGLDSNTFARLSAFTNVGFNVYGSARITMTAASASFQYLAIGY